MSLGGPLKSNCLWGGYSRVPAAGVSQPCARRTWPNFSGRASSVLALRTSRLERIGAVSAASIRHAKSMTYGRGLGDVAQRYVARQSQGTAIESFFSVSPLIANLTTRADRQAMDTGGQLPAGADRRGAFPLSRARPLPHLGRGAAIGNSRNLRPSTCRPESPSCLGKIGRSQFWQAGSGVSAAPTRRDLGAKCAESDRGQAGRGSIGAHVSLGAGRRSSLRAPRNPVNVASTQKYPRGVWYGSQGPQRAVIGPRLAVLSTHPATGRHRL